MPPGPAPPRPQPDHGPSTAGHPGLVRHGRQGARWRLGVLAVGIGLVVALAGGEPAAAAPARPMACPQPVADRYEPGDEVMVVGYTNGCVPNVDDGSVLRSPPLYGYLHETVAAEDPSRGTELGRYSIEDSPHEPRGYRMRLRFTLPDDIEPGRYYVHTCERPCETALVYGPPQAIYVGVDPPEADRPDRGWPLEDPAIANLDDDALVLGEGGEAITAAEVRSTPRGDDNLDEDDVAISDEADAPETDGNGGGIGPLAVGLVLGAIALGGWLVINRRTGGRKQIRRGPSGP